EEVCRVHCGGTALGPADRRHRAVVHAPQQHRLVEHRDPPLPQARHHGGELPVDLPAVVDVENDAGDQGGGGQPGETGLVDTGGNHHRETGVYPQAPHMGYGGQLRHQPGEVLVVGGQGVAAAEDHLGDGGIPGDVAEGRLPLVLAEGVVLVGKVTAKAVAAVHRAGGAGD